MRSIFFLIWLSLLSGLAQAEQEPLYEDLGNWEIHVDTSLKNSCFAMGLYEDYSILRLGFNKTQGNMYIILSDPNWKSIEAGKGYDVQIQFGDESKWSAEATGFSFDEGENQPLLWVTVESDSADLFLYEFMRERYLVLYYNNRDILRLKLTGTYRAGQTLLKCQKEMNSVNQDPFSQGSSKQSDPFYQPSPSGDDPFLH